MASERIKDTRKIQVVLAVNVSVSITANKVSNRLHAVESPYSLRAIFQSAAVTYMPVLFVHVDFIVYTRACVYDYRRRTLGDTAARFCCADRQTDSQ